MRVVTVQVTISLPREKAVEQPLRAAQELISGIVVDYIASKLHFLALLGF